MPNTKQEQDDAYAPGKLQNLEQGEGSAVHVSGTADAAREAEENPTPSPRNAEFVNKFTRNISSNPTKKSFFKGKGPLLFIGGGIGFGGVGLLLLIVPAILFSHLLANMFDTFDPSATALTQVTKRMVLNKLGAGADATTSGGCGVIKIACRFKTPSNELLRQLKDNGITAIGPDGKTPMDLNTGKKWPTTKPTKYRVSAFYAKGGEALYIDAKDLKGALQNNTEFRIAFNKTVKRIGVRAFSRFSPAFLNVIDRFRVKLRNSIGIAERTATTESRSIGEIIEEALKLRGAAGEAVEGVKEAASLIKSNISLRVNKLLTLIGRTGKGSGIVLAMAMQCMANEIPGMAKKAMVAIQETAMISAGSPIVTGMSAIKAGDGDPETATALGNMWTEQTSDGNSALSSAGVKYALNGDKDTSSDPTYNTVMPAAFGDTLNNLDIADKILKNPISNTECAALMNPISGAAIAAGINVAVAGTSAPTFGASFAVNLVLGVTMTVLIDTFSNNISDLVGDFVAPSLGAITQPTLDKMNLPGQTFGNVVTSTVGALSEHTGAQTFGTALTTEKLSAYSKDIQAQQLADAELDRATLSPFDASSRYTFLGSMVNQLMPFYSSLDSIQGGLSVIGSLLPTSFGSLLRSSVAGAATDPANLYSDACPNSDQVTATNGKTLAADIFCHTVYGMVVPDSWDPNTTVATMESMPGAIDGETGEAIVDDSPLSNLWDESTDLSAVNLHPSIGYGDWLETCTDPENAAQCTGDDDQQTTYGLYTAAKTVNAMLDMDPTDSSSDTVYGNEAYDMNLGDESLIATDTVDTTTFQSLVSLFSVVIPLIHPPCCTYNATTSTSLLTSTPLTNPLTRFALWR